MSLPQHTLTVTRYSAGSLVKGRWVEGTPSTFTIKASVQPLRGKDIELLPEGRRTGFSQVLFTDTELKIITEGATPVNADRVSIDGSSFEVLHVEPWNNLGTLNHYRAIVTREGAKA